MLRIFIDINMMILIIQPKYINYTIIKMNKLLPKELKAFIKIVSLTPNLL